MDLKLLATIVAFGALVFVVRLAAIAEARKEARYYSSKQWNTWLWATGAKKYVEVGLETLLTDDWSGWERRRLLLNYNHPDFDLLHMAHARDTLAATYSPNAIPGQNRTTAASYLRWSMASKWERT